MLIANYLAYILVIVGALNWGLVGMFQFDLVAWLFGGTASIGAIIVYILVALAGVWLIVSPFITRGNLKLSRR